MESSIWYIILRSIIHPAGTTHVYYIDASLDDTGAAPVQGPRATALRHVVPRIELRAMG